VNPDVEGDEKDERMGAAQSPASNENPLEIGKSQKKINIQT